MKSFKDRMMKRLFSILLICILAALLLAGCSRASVPEQTSAEEEPVTLTVWFCYDRNVPGAYYVFLWDTIAEQYGYEVEVKTYSEQEIENKLQIATVSNELPDIFYVPGGTYSEYLFDAGACLPVQDALAGADFKEEYTAVWTDGNQYVIPCMPESYMVTYYDCEVMEKIGLEIPETWEDLQALVEQVDAYNEANGTDYSAIELGVKDNWMGQLFCNALAQQSDPETYHAMTESGEVFSEGICTDAATRLSGLLSSGAFPDNYLEIGEAEAVNNFIQHDAVMMVHQSSLVYHLVQNMGQDGFILDTFPSGADTASGAYIMNLNHTYKPGLAVSSRSEFAEEAVSLCMEFAAQVNETNVEEYGYLNISQSTYELPDSMSENLRTLHALTENATASDPFWGAVLPGDAGDTWGNLTKRFFAREINVQDYVDASRVLAE